MRIFLTARWPADRPPGALDRWLPALSTPPEPEAGPIVPEGATAALRAWLALRDQAAALRSAGEAAAEADIILVVDPADPACAHLPRLRAAVVEHALRAVGEGALQRTRRFDAVLFHAPSLPAPVIVGATDQADVLAALAEVSMASGQDLVVDGEEAAAGRSPQCYLDLVSVVALPLVHHGTRVGAAVAESGQIGRFSRRELDPVREMAARAARLLV